MNRVGHIDAAIDFKGGSGAALGGIQVDGAGSGRILMLQGQLPGLATAVFERGKD